MNSPFMESVLYLNHTDFNTSCSKAPVDEYKAVREVKIDDEERCSVAKTHEDVAILLASLSTDSHLSHTYEFLARGKWSHLYLFSRLRALAINGRDWHA
jgi:hypothetical protein